MDSGEIKAIAEAAKDVLPVKDAYCDAIRPAARQLGKAGETLGMIINTLLLPIRHYVFNLQAKQEQLEKELTTRLSEVPTERIVEEAPLHVVVPAVQAWGYSMEREELRNLYANLLANAMLIEKQSDIHPGLVEIIRQLHPFEAQIFSILVAERTYPVVEVKSADNRTRDKLWRLLGVTGSFFSIDKHCTVINYCGKEMMPKSEYIANLERLGLIGVTYQNQFTNKKKYSSIEAHAVIKEYERAIGARGRKALLEYGMIELTPFGELFASICLERPK